MKKYILDTFQIPLNEEESKKYFFKSNACFSISSPLKSNINLKNYLDIYFVSLLFDNIIIFLYLKNVNEFSYEKHSFYIQNLCNFSYIL